MKKLLAFLGVFIFCFSLTAYAGSMLDLNSDYFSGDYGYNLNEDGSATIISFNKNKIYENQYYTGGPVLYIPSMLDGHPVTKLEGGSFVYNTPRNITTIVVPEGVTTIDSYALNDEWHPTVYLPSTLTYIGRNAFKGVKTVICNSTNVEIEDYAFRDCKGTTFYGHPSSTLEEYVTKTNKNNLDNCVFANIAEAPAVEATTTTYVINTSPIGYGTKVTITSDYAKAGELITITVNCEDGAFTGNILGAAGGIFMDGTDIAITNHGNGVYTFIMPSANVYLDIQD